MCKPQRVGTAPQHFMNTAKKALGSGKNENHCPVSCWSWKYLWSLKAYASSQLLKGFSNSWGCQEIWGELMTRCLCPALTKEGRGRAKVGFNPPPRWPQQSGHTGHLRAVMNLNAEPCLAKGLKLGCILQSPRGSFKTPDAQDLFQTN